MKRVVVYGADWCPLTRHAKDQLGSLGVEFEYRDVDHDPEASAWVKAHNNGKEIKPTIDIDGHVLSSPNDAEIEEALV